MEHTLVKKVMEGYRVAGQSFVAALKEIYTWGWGTISKDSLQNYLRASKTSFLLFLGLTPLLVVAITPGVISYQTAHWMIAFYYSAFWAIFFRAVLKPNVNAFRSTLVFAASAMLSFTLLFFLIEILGLKTARMLAGSEVFLVRWLGMWAGVAFPEEVSKAAVVMVALWSFRKEKLEPRDIVYLALLAGLGFGISEGVDYQLGANSFGTTRSENYLLNLLRMTSLPFLHATWTALAVVVMCIFRMKKGKALAFSAFSGIMLSSILHATYNATISGEGALVGFAVATLSAVLLYGTFQSVEFGEMRGSLAPEKTEDSVLIRRIGARVTDCFVVGVPTLLLSEMVTSFIRRDDGSWFGVTGQSTAETVSRLVIQVCLPILCFAFMHWKFGTTPGKRFFSLKIDSLGGKTFKVQLIREIVLTLSWPFIGLGPVVALANPERRMLHDFVSHTQVTDAKGVEITDEIKAA